MCFRRGSSGALRLLVSSTLLSLSPMASFAQSDWPNRPVTIMVGYSAGSAADIVARTLANPLAQKLGQSFVVENRSGADAMIAGRAVARAEPTGYTVGFGSPTSWALTLNLQPQLMGFDPRKDYAPVSLVGETQYVLIVNSDLGVNSINDLVTLARRSKPGVLNFSSTGEGSVAHLGTLMIAKKLGIEMTHVPYKSTAQSIVDVASGVIQLQLATISPTLPLYQSGKVRILGIASDQRSPLLPEVPTLAEQGAATQAGFSMGLVVPAGTPEPIVERLNKAVAETLDDGQVRSSYFKQGVQPRASSPKAFGQYIEAEIESYRRILSEFSIAPR